MSIEHPIDAAILADYWLAALTASEEEAVEEHLFGCDVCGARLREMIEFAEGVRKLASEGSLTMVVSDEFVKRVAEQGFQVRRYSPPNSGSVQCTVSANDNFLIAHLAADLSAAKRVDISFHDPQGMEQGRLRDIPFHPGAPGVTYQQSIVWAKAAPSGVLIARLVAFDEAGSEHLVGEYTFDHERTIPGPASW